MIEVFKTNVEDPNEAEWLIRLINNTFSGCQVNFDLEDCDRIMRVKCDKPAIDTENIISLLKDSGFKAEVLHDDFTVDITNYIN